VIAENLQSLTFYYMALGAVINIILNLAFIKTYGIVGAAWATVITQFLITLVIPLFFRKMRVSTWMLYKSYFIWKIK
jgi:Na+-driven multidrug efflux pump